MDCVSLRNDVSAIEDDVCTIQDVVSHLVHGAVRCAENDKRSVCAYRC